MPSAGDRAQGQKIWDSPGVSSSGQPSEPDEVEAERLGEIRRKRAEQAVSIMFQNSTPMGLNKEDEKSVRDGSAFSKWEARGRKYAILPRIEPTFLSWESIPPSK